MSSTPDPAVVRSSEAQDPQKPRIDPDISDPGASEERGLVAPVLASAYVPETSRWEIWSWPRPRTRGSSASPGATAT
ncbi:hypothetical protein NUW58_g4271 [Xylaria curta]|uniref:Uncharacterized protein n=1 Tax=Xylaria curta TaxID=42375 RepID=A0ACC1P9U8_9PEZI|nr:hypothetical protein NUW58_g4271 [Xylaria curta]